MRASSAAAEDFRFPDLQILDADAHVDAHGSGGATSAIGDEESDDEDARLIGSGREGEEAGGGIECGVGRERIGRGRKGERVGGEIARGELDFERRTDVDGAVGDGAQDGRKIACESVEDDIGEEVSPPRVPSGFGAPVPLSMMVPSGFGSRFPGRASCGQRSSAV